MNGMGSGSNMNNPVVVTAFHRALLHQSLIALVLLAMVMVAGRMLRGVVLRRAQASGAGAARPSPGEPSILQQAREPDARRLLRISFGLLWLFDGLLQAQSSMPLGMIPNVINPAAQSSPSWVQHLVASASNVWSYHPVTAAVAAVWIQVGIGLWLLVAPRGAFSRVAGVVSVGWAVLVWIFGEAFGQIFGSGLTWLFGAPGAVLFYAIAGLAVALPDTVWAQPRLGRLLLRTIGVFLVGMAVLQAWPGRGFWQGGSTGSLTSMVQQMAQTPQPSPLRSLVSSFASFDAAHGWAVNLFAVTALALIGACFLTARPVMVKWGLLAATVFCLADWVFIEDLGFLGGVGTDPNSMIPMLLVIGGGYLALTRPVPDVATAPVVAPAHSISELVSAQPAFVFRGVASVAAIAVTLLGAVPMLAVTPNRHSDTILETATDGPLNPTNAPATGFSLVNQNGAPVSLTTLRGKTVALTFLDPVCTTDCPIVGAEFRQADQLLGAKASKAVFVAVDANPTFRGTSYLRAYDDEVGLSGVSNWDYLTGPLPALEAVWRSYGIEVTLLGGGAMVDHNDVAYVIDQNGESRYELSTDPGDGSGATQKSFAEILASTVSQVMSS